MIFCRIKMDHRRQQRGPTCACNAQIRRGITMVELVISSVLLLTVMTFVTSICFRINLVWKDVNHHRVALGELANQLETLTVMTPDEANVALEKLEPSEICQRTLGSAKLSGEAIQDDLGTRIVLRMAWHRDPEVKPVELAGWIVSATPRENETSAEILDSANVANAANAAKQKGSSKTGKVTDPEYDEPPTPRLEGKQ